MRNIFRFVRLLRQITLKGKLRHTGINFSETRNEVLKTLAEFCPDAPVEANVLSGAKKHKKRNPLSEVIRGELAFLTNRLRSGAGHIHTPLLNLSYVRIPKAASTAISSAMLHARYPALQSLTLTPAQINYLADANLSTRIKPSENNATFFTLVRNPFARIVSVYREFFENKDEHFIYEDYLFGIFRHVASFQEFVTILQLVPDLLKDQHLRPQHLYLKYYHRKKIPVRICKLEESFAWKDFLRAHALEIQRIHACETPYDYRTYYDRKTLRIVCELYRADISQFGYIQAHLELQRCVNCQGENTAD